MAEQIKGEVVNINDLQVPEVLYKYRCFGNKHHENAVYDCEIYIPSPDGFNDPFDSKIPFRFEEKDLTEENIRKKTFDLAKQLFPDKPRVYQEEIAMKMQNDGLVYDDLHLDRFDRFAFERLCKDYGIYCLTPDEKNLLMWSYYADSHRGFCIGYNAKYLVRCGLFSLGGEIAYANGFPKMPLFLTKNDRPLIKLLFTKWEVWKHEKEYRFVHNYKRGKVYTLPKQAITEVILGCNVPEKQRMAFVNIVTKALPHVKIYQIEQCKKAFGLEKKPILDDKLFLDF